jgi:chromosome segregation ATPase
MTPAQLHDALANGLTAQQIEDQSAEDDEFERMERESQPAALEASTADSVHQINMRRATNRFEQLMIENKNLHRNLTFWRDSYSLLSRTAHAAERGIERADDEFIRMSGDIERLTAECHSLQEGLDGWHARYLDMETQCDAAMAAVAMKPICVGKDLEKMSGESGVLRELLAESLSVIKTMYGADECECDLLESMCDKIKAAITPQAETGDLL